MIIQLNEPSDPPDLNVLNFAVNILAFIAHSA